jgi:Protein of unknown function (DUF3984)
VEIKRSSSTFFLSSLPSYRHDWTYLHGARVTAEGLEEQGRSWLVSRASSTDLIGQQVSQDDDEDEEESEELYHRHTRDLEIMDICETFLEESSEEEQEEEAELNLAGWIRTFMEFWEESDYDEDIKWEPPRRRMVAFADGVGEDVDDGVVQRARERDEEHGMDGWMDGAAYLAFLGARAFGGFF